MRTLFALLATLALAQCATPQDKRFQVGANPQAFVYIGVAEAQANTAPSYIMLWRRIDPTTGQFLPVAGDTTFEVHTNDGSSLRVPGTPGEFEWRKLQPGLYGLDSVFAVIPDGHVNYVAQGVIAGPERPTFQIAPGDAVYLGIWQMDLSATNAVTQLWRLDANDMRTVTHAANRTNGDVRLLETGVRAVPCAPHRLTSISERQVC
jgi:hypothetical protein